MLGALLVAIVSVAIAISVRIYTQLDSAVMLERTLVDAQRELDDIVESQVNLQNQLRGFVATGDSELLEPYERYTAGFATDLGAFTASTRSLGIADMDVTIREMHDLHESWIRDVARPLLRDRHAGDARTREMLGKLYVDELNGDTARLRDLLRKRLADAQAELKLRIDEALFGGIASIVVFGFVSIAFVTARVQMQSVIDRERSIVETLGGAFRTDVDLVPGARVGTAYISADRDAAVGGDLYDVRSIDASRSLVIVADVSGKGIEAAVNTAFVKYSIRALVRKTDDPAAILDEFNHMFLETVADPNLFVVGFVGVLDGTAATLTYASAGHSAAYLRRGETVTQLEVTGPIVGLDASFGYGRRVARLERGDTLLLATDGLTEARDADGEFLGDAGAMQLFASIDAHDAQSCADAVVEHVRRRSGGTLRDDLAMLVIAIDGEPA